MHVVSGASGQVGSAVAKTLLTNGEPVTGVVRDAAKASDLKRNGMSIAQADLFDASALQKAFQGADTVFLLTPENPASNDVLGDVKAILKNYRDAIHASGIQKIVGLSSIGAQHASGTGNLEMSYLLEHAFHDLPVQQIFIRATYYYSNWMPYISTVQQQGILPTFFPVDLKIPMGSPVDTGTFIAEIMMKDIPEQKKIYELTGTLYSSADVASVLGNIFHRKVTAQPIPKNQWSETLQQAGFTRDAAHNLIKMTEAVIDGRTLPEQKETDMIKLPASLEEYFQLTLHEPALNK
jgi:uncharacterized protein YbjT (DUF2867 family)